MEKQKIAVIGSGVGAITSVYALTRESDWQKKYEITVYQLGWRAGGKGASGRNMAEGGRIEEHGLHIWAGFYDNAFRNMRSCYEDLVTLGLRSEEDPLGTLDKAFKPLSHLFLAEHVELAGYEPSWRPWLIDLPTNDLVPGTAESAPTPFGMFLRLLSIMWKFLEDGAFTADARQHLGEENFNRLKGGHSSLHDHAHGLPESPHKHTAGHAGLLVDLIEDVQSVVHSFETPEHLNHDATRRLLLLLDVGLAYARGTASSDVFTSGYDVLDQWEFTDWLRQNGASDFALNSVLLRGCYDFVFGYPHGRALAGNVGAGTAIRSMSRLLLTYRGAIFFKMQAGMGDTIFAPYYQVLSKIGVKFKFFNAATKLRLNDDGTSIAAIDMVEQAVPKEGEYQPLVNVENLPCWPSEPLWDQLKHGKKLKAEGLDFESEESVPTGKPYTLRAGHEFDQVILGASMGSLHYLTKDLSAASTRWREMLESVKTVGTQAAQFWLREPEDALGWRADVEAHNPSGEIPDGPLQTVITGFEEPLDTWADMSHLLPRENWGEDGPKAIAYFCSPAPDGETLVEFTNRVRKWTSEDLVKFWPKAADPEGFDDSILYKRPDQPGSAFDAQYFRVNMFGSERYVLSEKNTVYRRLAADESGFDNLVLAGDWTRCGINAGCVEAGTMSGISAAEAVNGIRLPNIGAEDIPSEASAEGKAMYETNTISGASWPLSGFYARGQMNGWFMFYHMPRDAVQKLLPKGMYLGNSPLSPHGMHTVGISLCHYQYVRPSFLPDFVHMDPYREASFAIPFVRTEATGRTQFLYPKRLYVDSKTAIFAGRFFYDMDKVISSIDSDDRSFTATDKTGQPFIESTFQQHKDPMLLADHPAFGTITSLLNLSFVTVNSRGTQRYNAFNLELDSAHAAPVSGQVKVTDTQRGGFPPSEFKVHPLQPEHPVGLPGGVRIWCSWSLTNPLDGKRIRHSADAQSWLDRTYKHKW